MFNVELTFFCSKNVTTRVRVSSSLVRTARFSPEILLESEAILRAPCKDLATSSDIYLRTKGAVERCGVELLCTMEPIGDIENAEAPRIPLCEMTVTTMTTTIHFISKATGYASKVIFFALSQLLAARNDSQYGHLWCACSQKDELVRSCKFAWHKCENLV